MQERAACPDSWKCVITKKQILIQTGKQRKWALSNTAETTVLRIPFWGKDGLPRPLVSGTKWGRFLLEKPTVAQLVVFLFLTFNWTRRFITVFTKSRHRSLSCGRLIQFITSQIISSRSILISPSHICLCIPSALFPSCFLIKTLQNISLSCVLHASLRSP